MRSAVINKRWTTGYLRTIEHCSRRMLPRSMIGAMRLPARADANIIELSPTDQAAGGMVFAARDA